jgi:hypothetical protein
LVILRKAKSASSGWELAKLQLIVMRGRSRPLPQLRAKNQGQEAAHSRRYFRASASCDRASGACVIDSQSVKSAEKGASIDQTGYDGLQGEHEGRRQYVWADAIG